MAGIGHRAHSGSVQHWGADLGATAEDRGLAEASAEASVADDARWRLQLLADAGVLLSRSLEWKTTVADVARLALGRFADWTVVDYLDDHARVRRLSVQHVDPARAGLAAEYAQYAPDGSRPTGVWLALRTGRPQLVSHVPGPVLDEAARLQRPVALARELGHASFIVVPLVARDRILGALTFVRGPGKPAYDETDLGFAEELARRAAVAMDNARLFRNAREAEDESRRAAARLRLLAEASVLFAEARLDLPRVLDAVACHVARSLDGDAVVLLPLPDGDGDPVPVAACGPALVAYSDRVAENRARALAALDRPWARVEDQVLTPGSVRERCPVQAGLGDGEWLVAPLLCDGAPVGALAVRRAGHAPRFGGDDQALLEDLAARAALALENARLYRQATEAISIRDGFLSVAGHELKTPLTALQLQLRCLTREVQDAARVSKLSRQCRRLSSLVDELLDVSRITAGRLRLELEELDLVTVARDRIQGLAEELDRADCEVLLLAPGPVVGRWDRLRVEQILSNLLSNAMKYGGGKPIDLTVHQSRSGARIQVRDRGMGIAAEDQERIFARFERAVSSRHFGGLGLGLWIARQVAEAHGGTITVASVPGEGATFTVDLPFAPPATR